MYSTARFSHEVTASILLTRPETFFAETAPGGDNDPVEYGNVTLDAAEIVAEARKLPAPKAPPATAPAAEETTQAAAADETTAAAA